MFLFGFSTPYIQTLIRRQSESIVNSTRIFCAVDIFWNIIRRQAIPVAKSHHVLEPAWLHDSAGDIDFLPNVSQPIRINNFYII